MQASGSQGSNDPGDVTLLLRQAAQGDRQAFNQLFPLVYEELKRLARGKLRFERLDHTLDTTALVHEAYLKLVDQDRVEWQSRTHFYAVASQAMRRILIDHAKMRGAAKRGGGAQAVPFDAVEAELPNRDLFTDARATELIALDDALHRLAEFNSRGAEVVVYRFFGGMSEAEIAEVLGVSAVTVRRSWTMAKAWLRRALSDEAPAPSESG